MSAAASPLPLSTLAPTPTPRGILNRTPSDFMAVLPGDANLSSSSSSDSPQMRCAFPGSPPGKSSPSPASRGGSPVMARGPSAPLPSAGSTLLARRRSSASEKGFARPALTLTSLADLHLDDLAAFVKDPHAIREHIIGVSAASETVDTPGSRTGDSPLRTPSSGGALVVERPFQPTKVRLPTPFPEKRGAFLSDDGEERDDDDSDDDSSSSSGDEDHANHRDHDVFSERKSVNSTGSSVASSVDGDHCSSDHS